VGKVGLILGVFAVALGLGLVLAGIRLFVVLLPAAVFLVGLYATGMAFASLGEEGGLLKTSVSILVGLAVGIGLSVLSYVVWYLGVLIVAGSIGATIGSGIVAVFSSEADVLHLVFAVAGAGVALFIAYEFNVPTWVVIVGTSLFGAGAMVLGILVTFGQIELDDLQYGPALPVLNHSWFWALAWADIAVFGIWVQYTTARDSAVPEGRWVRLQPGEYLRVGRRST
jgi:hypothetical protein